MAAIFQTTFQMHFPEWKYINFDKDFAEVRSQRSYRQYSNNTDPIHWRTYAALRGDEFKNVAKMWRKFPKQKNEFVKRFPVTQTQWLRLHAWTIFSDTV